MSLEWLDWDDADDEPAEEADGWSAYWVCAYTMFEEPLTEPWPVYAENFDAAMTVYEVLLRKKARDERSEYTP